MIGIFLVIGKWGEYLTRPIIPTFRLCRRHCCRSSSDCWPDLFYSSGHYLAPYCCQYDLLRSSDADLSFVTAVCYIVLAKPFLLFLANLPAFSSSTVSVLCYIRTNYFGHFPDCLIAADTIDPSTPPPPHLSLLISLFFFIFLYVSHR